MKVVGRRMHIRAKIVKDPDEISDELSVVRDVFKAADVFEFPRQMISDFPERGINVEATIPGTPILAVKAITAGPRMSESGVYERVVCFSKHKLTRIEAVKPALLCTQAVIRETLKFRKIVEPTLVVRQRPKDGLFQPARRNEPYGFMLSEFDRFWNRHSKAASHGINMPTHLQ